MEKIKVKDMDQCEDQGAKWVSSTRVTAVMTYTLSKQKSDFYRACHHIITSNICNPILHARDCQNMSILFYFMPKANIHHYENLLI